MVRLHVVLELQVTSASTAREAPIKGTHGSADTPGSMATC